jgi:hypothetical protein
MAEPLHIEVIDDQMAEILRAKSPAERLAIAHGMWLHAAQLIRRIVRVEHPEWSEAQISEQVAKRLSHGAI